MTLYRAYVLWGGLQALIESDSAEAVDYLGRQPRLLGRGEMTVAPTVFPAPARLVKSRLVYRDRTPEQIRVEADRIFLASPWPRARRADLLECLLAGLFERELQLRGRFSIHGSAVVLGRSAYLFMGPKEAGKTTMAHATCARLGGQVMANDSVIATWEGGGAETVAGGLRGAGGAVGPAGRVIVQGGDQNVHFTFRSHALREADPETYRRVFGPAADGTINLRRRVAAADLGLGACPGPAPLRRVYALGLGLTQNLDCRPLDSLDARLALHENIAARIRGASLILFDEFDRIGPWLPDLASAETHARLTEFLNRAGGRDLVWSLRGPLDQAVEAVREQAADEAAA